MPQYSWKDCMKD